MITDLKWDDIDGDGDQDIVIVGEWMNVTLLINDADRFFKKEIENSTGLWQCLEIADLDKDGLNDIIVGNFGTNSFLAQEFSTGISWGDFDGNLSFEPLIYYTNNGIKNPIAGRDLLISQMNFFKTLHPDYNSFAQANFEEMFSPVLDKKLREVEIQEFESCWYKNMGNGKYKKMRFPIEAQFAPIFSIDVNDYNQDGEEDILLGGNMYEVSPNIGRADASLGVYLESDGQGNYLSVEPEKSGLMLQGQIRQIEPIIINNQRLLLVAANNDSMQLWSPYQK